MAEAAGAGSTLHTTGARSSLPRVTDTWDIGGRGGYCPPLIRHSLGFGTHERGSRRLSPHPTTPYQADAMGRGGASPSLRPRLPRAAAGAPLRRRTKGGTEPRSERRLPLAGGHAIMQHTRTAHTSMHMAVASRGRGSSRAPRAPPSRSNPSPIYWGACPSRMPLPRPPPLTGAGSSFYALRWASIGTEKC